MNSLSLRSIGLATGSIIATLIIVSACSLYFRGDISPDYLITGLITVVIVVPVTLGLSNQSDQRLLALTQEHAEMLRLAENKYHLLYETSRDAIMMLDERGFSDCNNATLSMFGCTSKEDFCAKHPADLSPPKQPCGTDSLTLASLYIATALEQGILHFEWLHTRADTGKSFPAEVLLSAIPINGKQVLQAAVRDISKRKDAENALEKMNATLKEQVRQELAQLREKDHMLIEQSRFASMGEMIGNIAHQWRQPLTVLGLSFQNMRLDCIEGKLDKPAMDRYVSEAMNVVNMMSRTIDDFRHFFRSDSDKVIEFELYEATQKGVALIISSLAHHGIAVRMPEECNANGSSITAQGFPHQFSRVLLNLLSNAQDVLVERHVPAGLIEISCRYDGNFAIVAIRDNGGGIPADVFPKIFDPYFTTKRTGTGIGLYMSKVIMNNMNGDIRAHNRPDGAEFILSLPAVIPRDAS